MQDLLLAYTNFTKRSARVLWMSSLDSEPVFDPKDDWQLTKTHHSYQASKYQIDLIASELEKRTVEAQETGRASTLEETVAPHGEIHHIIISPGITSTNMSALLNIWIPGWRYLMVAAFWIVRLFPLHPLPIAFFADRPLIHQWHVQVRFLGAPHVLMSLFAAAVSSVHLALVPLRHVPTARDAAQLHISPLDVEYPHWHAYYGQSQKAPARVQALRFGSENDRWGNERPGVVAVPVWEEHPNAGEVLLERFERLYQAFAVANAERERGESGGGAVNGHGNGNGKAR